MMSATSLPFPSRENRVRSAARELWLRHGYAVSMNAVAEKAGCSKQTIYAHFGTKDELFRQVIDELVAPMTAPLDSRGDDLRASLIDFARSHLDFVASADAIAQYRRLIGEFERFPEASRSAFASASEVVCGRLADLLGEWMRRGRLRADAPDEVAELLLSMINGLQPIRQLFELGRRDGDAIERWIARAVDTFLQAWAIAPGRPDSVSFSGSKP